MQAAVSRSASSGRAPSAVAVNPGAPMSKPSSELQAPPAITFDEEIRRVRHTARIKNSAVAQQELDALSEAGPSGEAQLARLRIVQVQLEI